MLAWKQANCFEYALFYEIYQVTMNMIPKLWTEYLKNNIKLEYKGFMYNVNINNKQMPQ